MPRFNIAVPFVRHCMIIPFYPNVTWRSGLCYRKSLCLSVVCLSVCRSSVYVHAPYIQGVEPFGNISSPLCCVPLPSSDLRAKFYGDRPGNPSARGVKRKKDSKIERWWTYRKLYLINGTRYDVYDGSICHHLYFSPHSTAFLPERDYVTFGSLLSQFRLSVVCLSVVCLFVTLVHPTQRVELFGKISSPLCTLAILWPPCKILRRSSQGKPSVGSVKRKRGSKIQRFWCWTYRRLYLTNGTR